MLRTEATKVETGTEDEDGVLVFDRDRLVAVMVHLAAKVHDPDLAGKWSLEARFDTPSFSENRVFSDVASALEWLQRSPPRVHM